MMKSSLILFLILLHHTYAQPGDEGNRYEPLMNLVKIRAPAVKTFLFGNPQFLNGASVIENFMCPAETDEDISNLEEASKKDYTLKYCLFRKKIQKSEERICKKEVKPVFHEILDKEKNNIKCGKELYQTLHGLSYHYCGELDQLTKFHDKRFQKDSNTSHNFTLTSKLRYPYQICYDTVKKSVLWTVHNVQSPQLFQNPYFQNQPEFLESEINTDSYFMNPNLFLSIKERYELEKQKDASKPETFAMVPRPLVPAEYYAISTIRKFTHHYINMAPLWDKLVPLMTAIDEGIKQAQMNLESKDPNHYNDLIIHTRVAPHEEVDTTLKTWFNLLLFRGNIWYKYVRQQNVQSAVLILIHNTPGTPPSPSTGCLVGEKQKCNFQTWSKDENIRDRIKSDDLVKYAYCCKVDAQDINAVFSHSTTIEEYLNIDSLLIKDGGVISN